MDVIGGLRACHKCDDAPTMLSPPTENSPGSTAKLPRLAVLGFDAMDATLVRRWAAAGRLPTFARLLDTCAWTQFDLPPDHSSGMVWPSINTGLAPADHNAYFGTRLVEGTYTLRPRCQADLRGTPFWRELAARGRRLVLMDVPFSQIDADCGGLQIVGWGQHEKLGKRACWPPRLLTRIERDFGRYPVIPSVEDTWARGGPDELVDALLLGIERRTRILHHLANASAWDFFYGVFHEAHGAGHHLWHLSDATHPCFNTKAHARRGDPLLRVYRALDSALHSLAERLGEDSTLAIIFSHGMGPNYNGDHLFPELLARFNRARGGVAPGIGPSSRVNRAWASTIGRLPLTARHDMRRLLPQQVRRWLSNKRQQHPRLWRNEFAFALPGLDGFSAVRVNLAGREPGGIISAGQEYDSYVDALQDEIESWTVGQTGRPAVARIHRATRGAQAMRIGVAPDLMLWWNKAGPIEEIRSCALGIVRGVSDAERSGEHVMHSFVMLRRSDQPGAPHSLSGMGIRDIAPTLLLLATTGKPDPQNYSQNDPTNDHAFGA